MCKQNKSKKCGGSSYQYWEKENKPQSIDYKNCYLNRTKTKNRKEQRFLKRLIVCNVIEILIAIF